MRKVYHARPADHSGTFPNLRDYALEDFRHLHRSSGVTIVVDDDNPVAYPVIHVAVCSHKDQYCKKAGIKRALERFDNEGHGGGEVVSIITPKRKIPEDPDVAMAMLKAINRCIR